MFPYKVTLSVCQEAPMGVGEADEVPADAVGRRVACGEERATVRYVGPVPPTEGRSD